MQTGQKPLYRHYHGLAAIDFLGEASIEVFRSLNMDDIGVELFYKPMRLLDDITRYLLVPGPTADLERNMPDATDLNIARAPVKPQ